MTGEQLRCVKCGLGWFKAEILSQVRLGSLAMPEVDFIPIKQMPVARCCYCNTLHDLEGKEVDVNELPDEVYV